MPPQEPQIYDIAPIPFFAGAPGLVAWAIFLLGAAAVLYWAWIKTRPERVSRVSPAIANAVLRDIEAARLALAAERPDPRLIKEVLAVLSISTRRAVGPAERFDALSPQQLDARVAELEASGKAPPYAPLLQLLAAVEYYKYIPDSLLKEEHERLQTTFQNFARIAKEYFLKPTVLPLAPSETASQPKELI
jgi:hypothetical protein